MAVFYVVGSGLVFVAGHAGWWLARELLRRERDQLHIERQQLQAGWQALEQTRRVRETFLAAHQTMRREADRQFHRGRDRR